MGLRCAILASAMPQDDDDEERISLAGLDPEDALRGLLAVDPDETEMPDFSDPDIPEQKLRDYLLSPTHKDGRHKLALFESRFGVGPDDRERCVELLMEVTRQGTIEDIRERDDCRVYAIRGTVAGVDGQEYEMRVCWKVPREGGRASFVTAYPPK